MEIGRNRFIKSLAGMACLSAFGGEVKCPPEVESAKCKSLSPEFNESYFKVKLSLYKDSVRLGGIPVWTFGHTSWEDFCYKMEKQLCDSLMKGRINEFLEDDGVNYPCLKDIQLMKRDLEGWVNGGSENWTEVLSPDPNVGIKSTNVLVRVFKVNGEDGKYKYVEWWGASITRTDGYVANMSLRMFEQTNGAIEKDIDYTFLTKNGLLKEVNESEL